jgi:hypothetical protein
VRVFLSEWTSGTLLALGGVCTAIGVYRGGAGPEYPAGLGLFLCGLLIVWISRVVRTERRS